MANVYTIIPYSLEKNLGKAYNEQIAKYDTDDWLILQDIDVLTLTPDTIRHIHTYIEKYPRTGIFTCYTNRVGNMEQLLFNRMTRNDDLRHHLAMAKNQQQCLYRVTELRKPISGFLMVIKKATWENIQFNEDLKCLGVDNDFDRRVRAAGYPILRMDGIYVWHTYRLLNGQKDKAHLK